ncbi:hypothetical protein ES708_24871 [subsurface metagenome]
MFRMQISCVVITKNEEKNIERCIKSVESVVDEIIIVDSFSTDRTKEICEKLNVKFVEHAFEGHIEQKNWAITQAKYNHILSLDADEVLSEKLRKSIFEVKNNWAHDGYYFNRLTNYCGKWIRHCGWYPDHKLRLWDSRKGKWTGINPHDKYEMNEDTKIKFIKGDLLHYSYHTITQHIDQINKFTDIGAEAAYRSGIRSNLLLIIVKPIWKFIRDYFIKLGILDGYYGFLISIISSYATSIKYIKIKELQKSR